MLVGIDEVGRGCWAGPLVAAAVMLKSDIDGLADSKRLSKSQREKLAIYINQTSNVGLGWVSPAQVDKWGLTKSVEFAMSQALNSIGALYNQIIIDGNYNFLSNYQLPLDVKLQTVVRADGNVPAVSAASIIAKVARDKFMHKAANKYPQYGFEKHVGYGTRQHLEMLKKHGPCPMHRFSYKPIKAITPGALR